MAVLDGQAGSASLPPQDGKGVARWPPSVGVPVESGRITARLRVRIPTPGGVITRLTSVFTRDLRGSERDGWCLDDRPDGPAVPGVSGEEVYRGTQEGPWGPPETAAPTGRHATRPADLVFVPTSAC